METTLQCIVGVIDIDCGLWKTICREMISSLNNIQFIYIDNVLENLFLLINIFNTNFLSQRVFGVVNAYKLASTLHDLSFQLSFIRIKYCCNLIKLLFYEQNKSCFQN